MFPRIVSLSPMFSVSWGWNETFFRSPQIFNYRLGGIKRERPRHRWRAIFGRENELRYSNPFEWALALLLHEGPVGKRCTLYSVAHLTPQITHWWWLDARRRKFYFSTYVRRVLQLEEEKTKIWNCDEIQVSPCSDCSFRSAAFLITSHSRKFTQNSALLRGAQFSSAQIINYLSVIPVFSSHWCKTFTHLRNYAHVTFAGRRELFIRVS